MRTKHNIRKILLCLVMLLCFCGTAGGSAGITKAKTVWEEPVVKKDSALTISRERINMKQTAKKNRKRKSKKRTVKWKTKIYASKKVREKTVTNTSTVTTYKKGSKVKTVVIRTVRNITTYTYTRKEQTIRELASLADPILLDAFEQLGYELEIDSSYIHSGYFNAKQKMIQLKKADDCIYHELGHFLSFLAGNADQSKSFLAIYEKEKEIYSGFNKNYVIKNSSEYFAESYKDYVLDGNGLQAKRPETYAAICNALSQVTSERIEIVAGIYRRIQ